jgi:hypothetical protein
VEIVGVRDRAVASSEPLRLILGRWPRFQAWQQHTYLFFTVLLVASAFLLEERKVKKKTKRAAGQDQSINICFVSWRYNNIKQGGDGESFISLCHPSRIPYHTLLLSHTSPSMPPLCTTSASSTASTTSNAATSSPSRSPLIGCGC